MSQPLTIRLHTTFVSGAGYYRQDGKWSIDNNPGLSTVEVHHNGDDEDDDGDGEVQVGEQWWRFSAGAETVRQNDTVFW